MKKWVVYTGYIVIVTLFFLYYLFPGNVLTFYINSKLSNSFPELHLTVSQIRPSFPPGLSLKSPVLFRQDQQIIGADAIKIIPQYLTLLSPTKAFVFNGSSYGGTLKGKIDLTTNASSPLVTINLLLDNINIGSITAIKQLIPYSIAGLANGSIIYSTNQPYGKGKANIGVSGCQIDFKPPLFGIEQLTMDTIQASGEMDGRRVKIDQFEIKGRDVSGKATGSMVVWNPISKSTINISGQLTPTPAMMKNMGNLLSTGPMGEKKDANGNIPFRISGTIENPSFSLK